MRGCGPLLLDPSVKYPVRSIRGNPPYWGACGVMLKPYDEGRTGLEGTLATKLNRLYPSRASFKALPPKVWFQASVPLNQCCLSTVGKPGNLTR